MARPLIMKPRFVADGAVRLEQSEEFQARLRELRERIHKKYAAELSTAGLVRRCVLRWRIAIEYRREEQRIVPSSQALYSSGINLRAFNRNNSVAKNARPRPCPLPQGEGETFARPLVKRPSSVVLCLRSERRRSGDCNRSVRIFHRCASALPLLRNSFCKSLVMKDRSKTGRFFAIFGGIRAT